MANATIKSIYTFCITTLGFSSVFYYLIIKAGTISTQNHLYVYALMWCPALGALLTSSFFNVSFTSLGLKLQKPFYLLVGLCLPLVYLLIAYTPLYFLPGASGAVHFCSLQQLLYGIGVSSLLALGEEIGWRGFLVPQLSTIFSFRKTALLSGFIWALWHIPLIIWADYGSTAPLWFSVPVFIVNITCLGIIAAWLRVTTKNIWPAVLLHASHNFFLFSIFSQLVREYSVHPLQFLKGECGIALTLPLILISVYLLKKG